MVRCSRMKHRAKRQFNAIKHGPLHVTGIIFISDLWEILGDSCLYTNKMDYFWPVTITSSNPLYIWCEEFLNDKSCATSMSSNNYAVQRHSKTSQNMLSTQKLIKELIIHLCHKRISNPVDKDSRLACLWNNFKFLNCNWREFERFWRLCLKECRVIDFLCKSDEI